MRDLLLVAWVVPLCAAVHIASVGPIDVSSFAFGILAVTLVWVIRWDELP